MFDSSVNGSMKLLVVYHCNICMYGVTEHLKMLTEVFTFMHN